MQKRNRLAALLPVVAMLLGGCGGGDNNISVYHVGGNITGLIGAGLVLQNNAGTSLPITANGTYRFPTTLTNGSSYAVKILALPVNPAQTCAISNASGAISGSDVTNVNIACTADYYTVGGNVTGLNSSGLVLQNNGGDDLHITFSGGFQFSTPLVDTSAYSVTILSQPDNPIRQTCTVTNGSGVLAGSNVNSVSVDCVTNTYTIGGTVSGLSGSGLVLQNNAGDDLPLSTSGSFTFPAALDDGTDYTVTVKTQPSAPNQQCTVTGGSGQLAGSNVSNVVVTCSNAYAIGGTVSGLTGSGLLLQNNGGDDLPISANGSFTFPQFVADNSTYQVTVSTYPDQPVQLCTVSNSGGTVSGADVSNVAVNCADAYSVGGTITGLAGSGLVLQNNTGDDLSIAADGSFRFRTPLASGSGYAVSVLSQPAAPDQHCAVANGSGSIAAVSITTVAVNCVLSNAWAWQGGSNTINPPGAYGTLGTPDPNNFPPGRKDAVAWTDLAGVQWLFGGLRADPAYDPTANPPVPDNPGYLNDLWTYTGNIWTWAGGSAATNQPGHYGTQGTADAANIPGGRYQAVSWTGSGAYWLFGGLGLDSQGGVGYLNDYWKFDGSQWTWMGGSDLANQPGIYGVQGTPDAANIPAGRRGSVAWHDAVGNLWLFGGLQFDPNYTYDPNVDPPPAPPYEGYMNDLWRFDGNEWTWIGGSATPNPPGHYGTQGTASPANAPGGREGAMTWRDSAGNQWLFGGWGVDAGGNTGFLNDLWMYAGGQWTWVAGSNLANQPGHYGTQGTPDPFNIPGSRKGAVTWQDSNGNLWLLGGSGFDASGNQGYLNDLWKFDGSNWTWENGNIGNDQAGSYGTLGSADPASFPGGREGARSWQGSNGERLLFGGWGLDAAGDDGDLNDLWQYLP